MKKFLLSAAILAAFTASAQQTYNYFDPADCDADGWLWFDSQAKLDKYCGFVAPGKEYKVMLQTATFENADMGFDEPYLDPTVKGWNAEGVQGGEGSWTGGIVLCGSSTANGSDAPNGGGIMLQLPDCAEFGLALSTEEDIICVGLSGAKGWVEGIDCQTIQTYLKMGIFLNRPLARTYQYTWNNIQEVTNAASGMKLPTAPGEKATALVRNNRGTDLLVQGIKVFTYTDVNAGSAVESIGDDANAPVEYFNMQGMKVSGNEPGLYIRRQGKNVSKIVKY